MRLPNLVPIKARRDIIAKFMGYNHRDVISDGNNKYGYGEWYDCHNLTSDKYPTAKVREKRGELITSLGQPFFADDLFHANDDLGMLVGKSVYVKESGEYEAYNVSVDPQIRANRVVTMGAYVIVFPAKWYINTADTSDRGFFDPTVELSAEDSPTPETEGLQDMSYSVCDADGNDITYTASGTTPANPNAGDYWYNTTTDKMYQYGDGWAEVNQDTLYTKITFQWLSTTASSNVKDLHNIPDSTPINDGETVDIVMHGTSAAGGKAPRRGIVSGTYKLLKSVRNVTTAKELYLIIPGFRGEGSYHTFTFDVSIAGTPDLDYVFECGNRLWGCKYGTVNGKKINEIYASQLGDFRHWLPDEGNTSMGGYIASVGTDGPFTGGVKYQNSPIFFKERYMHKVYGSYPAQYQINTVETAGVEKGSWKSLAVVDNALYWFSPFGVMAYDGASPVNISSEFGKADYKNAAGGGHDGKYYLSVQDADDEWYTFVYDTRHRFWLKENWLHVKAFCSVNNELYMAIPGHVKTLNGSGAQESGPVEWYAESGDMGLDSPDRKYVSRLTVRMRLAVGTWVKIWVRYDGEEWEHQATVAGYDKLKTFSLPIRVRRCDHFRLKFEGCGDAQIYSITRTIEGGSDLGKL